MRFFEKKQFFCHHLYFLFDFWFYLFTFARECDNKFYVKNMKKNLFLLLVLFVGLFCASCNGDLKEPEGIGVNPNPLVLVGNKVDCEIAGTFPAKAFGKKGVLTVTPVLKYEGGEAEAEPKVFVGEKAKENGEVVYFKQGGTFTMEASFDFVPEMEKSELYLRFTAVNNGKEVALPDLKIADGVIVTQNLAEVSNLQEVLAPDKFQRIIQEMQEADIHFLIQQSNLRSSELKNKSISRIKDVLKKAKGNEKMRVNKFEISGYASPEGSEKLNTRLATDRQKNTHKYMSQELSKNKLEAQIGGEITAEDWEGFRKSMEQSSLEDKELVLRVLSMYKDPEEREAQIKNLSAVYKKIAQEILPALRRSKLKLTVDIIGKSDDEIKALFETKPDSLNVEELLYGATLYESIDTQLLYYLKTTEIYPMDYRAFNNIGKIEFERGNYEEANRSFLKALELNEGDADLNFNLAMVTLVFGDVEQAEVYLGKAAGTSGDYNTVKGTIHTLRGEYAEAQQAYANTPSNSAAVQFIINEDYATARQTLDNIEKPNATTAYLKAIVGARTNDRDLVFESMKSAIEQDEKFKTKAQRDIEFAKFVDDDDFQAIIR